MPKYRVTTADFDTFEIEGVLLTTAAGALVFSDSSGVTIKILAHNFWLEVTAITQG